MKGRFRELTAQSIRELISADVPVGLAETEQLRAIRILLPEHGGHLDPVADALDELVSVLRRPRCVTAHDGQYRASERASPRTRGSTHNPQASQ